MECGAPVSASLRCRILFAGESRLALAHGDWVCLHGVLGVFECWNHQCLVGRKLLPHRIAPRCRTVLCVHRSGVDDHPARNLFRSNVKATTDSDVFRVLPHDSLVRRTARSRFHGSLHRAAGKVTFQSSWPTCGARQLDYGWKPSPPVTRAVLEIRWTGGGDRQGNRTDGQPFEARGLHTNVHRWISSAGMVLCGGFAADSRPSPVPSELRRPGHIPGSNSRSTRGQGHEPGSCEVSRMENVNEFSHSKSNFCHRTGAPPLLSFVPCRGDSPTNIGGSRSASSRTEPHTEDRTAQGQGKRIQKRCCPVGL